MVGYGDSPEGNAMFCKHSWKKDHEFTGKSAMQQMADAGLRHIKNVHSEYFEIPHLVVYKCEKCGKLKDYRGNGG